MSPPRITFLSALTSDHEDLLALGKRDVQPASETNSSAQAHHFVRATPSGVNRDNELDISFMARILLSWFANVDRLNKAFAFWERALRQRENPDSVNGEALQGTAQRFEILAGERYETVLKSDLECFVAGILDQLGVLEIAVGEKMSLARLFHTQAMGAGIRAPAAHILCPRDCWCLTV